MPKRDGVHWRCPNRDCTWSFAAGLPGEEAPSPRCVCGSLMRAEEVAPTFRYLDFLQGERITEEEVGMEKE